MDKTENNNYKMTKTLLLNQGARQEQRLPAALKSGYIELEERQLEDFLQQVYAYAKNIHFTNKDNRADGDWSELLINNDSILLALIAKEKSSKRERELHRLLRGRYHQDFQILEKMVRLCLDIVIKLDRWFVKMQYIHSSAITQANRKLYEVIQLCKDELEEIYAIHTYLSHNTPTIRQQYFADRCKECNRAFASLSKVWGLPEKGVQLQEHKYSEVKHYRYRLEAIFYHFSNSLNRLSAFCQNLFNESLTGKQQEPAGALIVAFLQLLQKVNAKSNGFTDKHKNFYYRNVLKMDNKLGQPDQAILLIESNKNHNITIKERTTFLSEATDFYPGLEYASIGEVPIVPAKISAVANCYLHRDPYNVPAFDLGMINNIHAQQFADYHFMDEDWKKSSVLNKKPLGDDKSLFGAHLLAGQIDVQQKSDVGFMLASKILLLEQGRRQLNLQFQFEEKPYAVKKQLKFYSGFEAVELFKQKVFYIFKTYLFDQDKASRKSKRKSMSELICFQQMLRKKLLDKGMQVTLFDQKSKDSISSLAHVYRENHKSLKSRIFSKGFKLSISTDVGWQEVVHYECEFILRGDEYFCEFKFELDDSFPPVVACNSEQHNKSLVDTSFLTANLNVPVLKVLFSQESEFYLYSLLQDLVLKNVNINVDVKGVKNLVLHNDLGPIDITMPFQPFGTQPKTGNAFIVGSKEFSFKALSEISIDIEWHRLPIAIDGFKSYYHDYELDIDNQDFTIRTRVLRNSNWYSQDETNEQTLFTLNSENRLNKHSRLKIKDPTFFQPVSYKHNEDMELGYHSSASSGFFKLQLSGKSVAFAHDLYPHIMNDKLIQSIKSKKKSSTLKEPFTPLINRISVDYKANARINIELFSKPDKDIRQHQIYSVNPFGIKSLTQKARDTSAYLFPQYKNANSLYVGLDIFGDFIGGVITLYFELQESSVNTIRSAKPKLEWSWLAGTNNWKNVLPKDVLSDTTTGFLKSGIVTLRLSQEAITKSVTDNMGELLGPSIMDPEKLWIRVTTQHNPAEFCLLNGVEVNAVIVEGNYEAEGKPASLDAGSIRRSKITIPGIKTIYQPRPTLVGREKQNHFAWLQSSAERLRHRKRLVTSWDFERAVLEKFEYIDQVKYFPAQRIVNGVPQKSPGNILIIVIPRYQQSASIDLTRPPSLASATQLNTIKKFLSDASASGVKINVSNPNYEYIQLRCSVLFQEAYEEKSPHHALNRDFIHYISSWGKYGAGNQFDWEYFEDEIAAFIRELEYVEFVSNLSLLKVTQIVQDNYQLTDSVLENKKSKRMLTPKYPWSIAIPVNNHAIEILRKRTFIDAEVTGYSELELGKNFILS